MRIISYIPIRSGSRGLKDKNILKIASKPLFEWSVYFAKNLSKNKDIIVSSDSERYLKLASKLKISTEKRPVELASDTSTTESAIIYTIKRLLNNNLVKQMISFVFTSYFANQKKNIINKVKRIIIF